jgi:hypothetical protein
MAVSHRRAGGQGQNGCACVKSRFHESSSQFHELETNLPKRFEDCNGEENGLLVTMIHMIY